MDGSFRFHSFLLILYTLPLVVSVRGTINEISDRTIDGTIGIFHDRTYGWMGISLCVLLAAVIVTMGATQERQPSPYSSDGPSSLVILASISL